VSECGFTSKQRKKVIYGREKHRNRRNKEWNDRKVKGRKIGIFGIFIITDDFDLGKCLIFNLERWWL